MVSQTTTITNEEGLTVKAAANFCKLAVSFESLITFTFENTTANAKSVISVLGACVQHGDTIEIVCDGADEEEALAAMVAAVEAGLPEEEDA